MSKPLRTETVTAKMTADMRASLAAIAACERRSLSNVVALACERLIAERNNEKAPHGGGAYVV